MLANNSLFLAILVQLAQLVSTKMRFFFFRTQIVLTYFPKKNAISTEEKPLLFPTAQKNYFLDILELSFSIFFIISLFFFQTTKDNQNCTFFFRKPFFDTLTNCKKNNSHPYPLFAIIRIPLRPRGFANNPSWPKYHYFKVPMWIQQTEAEVSICIQIPWKKGLQLCARTSCHHPLENEYPPQNGAGNQKVWQFPAATGHSGWWRVSFNG